MTPVTANLIEFRSLLTRFYEGISDPEENIRIMDLAAFLNDNLPAHEEPTGIREDITLVLSLRNFGAIPSIPALSIPDDLERRLSSHIDALASVQPKRRNVFSRRLWFAGVAASAALFIFTGYKLVTDSGSPTLSPHSASSIFIAKVNEPVIENSLPVPEWIIASEQSHAASPSHSAAEENESLDPEPAFDANELIAEDFSSRQNIPPSEDTDTQGSYLPEHTSVAQSDNPFSLSNTAYEDSIIASEAYEEEENDDVAILVLPLSTLTAGIDNVFRTVSMVSESISVALTPALPEDNLPSADVPLQSIDN